MSFVDDDRPTFDPRQFCNTLKAVVSPEGRPTPAALSNPDLVKAAEASLDFFLDCAHTRGGIDVVALYLGWSPSAADLFSCLPLCATSLGTAITVGALRSLTSIAHYARYHPHATAARGVAKDIVKARAGAVFDVFVRRHSRCIRHALTLLGTVAGVHPLLARQVVDRFDLTSLTLPSHEHAIIRMHFVIFVRALVSVRDFDVLNFLATKGRPALNACVEIVAKRIKLELDFDVDEDVRKNIVVTPATVQRKDLQTFESFLRALRRAYCPTAEDDEDETPTPLNEKGRNVTVNRKNLRTQRDNNHINTHPSTSTTTTTTTTTNSTSAPPPPVVRRSLFGQSLLSALLTVATAPRPSLSIVPSEVSDEHASLRQTAASFFTAAAADTAIPAETIALALAHARAGQNLTTLTLSLVQANPRLAASILKQSRAFCGWSPSLSSQWLGGTAVIASALARVSFPMDDLRTSLLEPSLGHKSSLVRHVGATLVLGMTRLVEGDTQACRCPQRFLPSFKSIQSYIRQGKQNGKGEDLITQQLLASYQRLFEPDGEADEANRDMIFTALKVSQSNYLGAQHAIVHELDVSPRDALPKLTGRKYLSGMIVQAGETKRKHERVTLWNLASYAVKKAPLFPQGSLHDVDIILAVLSAYRGEKLQVCALLLEDVINRAISLPYGLFDELHGVDCETQIVSPVASLLIAACFIRLRNLCCSLKTAVEEKDSSPSSGKSSKNNLKNPNPNPNPNQIIQRAFLTKVLLLHVAFEEVMNGHVMKDSYLAQKLPSVLDSSQLWWTQQKDEQQQTSDCTNNNNNIDTPTTPQACDLVSHFLEQQLQYPSQPYLTAARLASKYRKALRTRGTNVQLQSANLGAMWDAVRSWHENEVEYDPKADPGVVLYGAKPKDRVFQWNDQAGLLLEDAGRYPSDASADEEVARLKKALTTEDFTVVICVILSSTQGSKGWNVALQRVMYDIAKELTSEKSLSKSKKKLARFRWNCLVSALRRCRSLDEAAFEKIFHILSLSADDDDDDKSETEKEKENDGQWQYEQLLFRLRLLHALVFHRQDSISARTRFRLSVKSTVKIPPLITMSSEVAKLIAQILPYAPPLRKIIAQQVSGWELEGEHRLMNSQVVQVVATAFSVPDLTLSETDNRYHLCSRLMANVSLTPGDDNAGGLETSRYDFLNDEAMRKWILHLGSWSRIEITEVASIFKATNVSKLTETLSNGIPLLLLWMYVSIQSGSASVNQHISNFSTGDLSNAINFLTSYLREATFDAGNELFSVMVTILRKLVLRLRNEMPEDGEGFSRAKMSKLLKRAFKQLSQVVVDWLSEDEAHDKNGNEHDDVITQSNSKAESNVFYAIFQCLASVVEVCPGLKPENYVSILGRLNRADWHFLWSRLAKKGADGQIDNKRKIHEAQISEKDGEFVICVCDLVTLFIDRLCETTGTDGVNEWLRGSLFKSLETLRSILTQVAEYHANLSAYDLSLKRCVRAIDFFFRQEGRLVKVFVQGSDLFNPDAATVLASFGRGVLESARDNVFHWNDSYHRIAEREGGHAAEKSALALLWPVEAMKADTDETSSMQRGADSEFVLRVLLAACVQARAAPGTAVIDIGSVARDGPLAVALTALSAPSAEARALGYACVQLFSEVVGPIQGVEADNAAGLYRERKQLAFILSLLRNSVGVARSGREQRHYASNTNSAYVRLLPLCMAWLITCIRIALQPGHDANKIIVAFLLRGPHIDVTTDCAGLFHLFSYRGLDREIQMSRLLALEILQRGARSAADTLVIRRRRMLDTVFMLAGALNGVDPSDGTGQVRTRATQSGAMTNMNINSSSGTMSTSQPVRLKALSVLDSMSKRQDSLGLTSDLCQMYGIIPWLCSDYLEPSHDQVLADEIYVRKLYILCNLIENGVVQRDETSITCLQDAFAVLVRRAWQPLRKPEHGISTGFGQANSRRTSASGKNRPKLVYATLRCSRALVNCDRWRVGLLDIDVVECLLCTTTTTGHTRNSIFKRPETASLVARQHGVHLVALDIVCDIFLTRNSMVETSPTPWNDVLVMDCFVARFVTRHLKETCIQQQKHQQKMDISSSSTDDDDDEHRAALSSSHHPEWIVKLAPLVANTLLHTPTVWTVVTALAVVVASHTWKRQDVPSDIGDIAARVPSEIPTVVSETEAQRFDSTVKEVCHDLTKALLDIT